ncbi:MAG: DegV family protein [Lachnospiraceae bacterium]|nr:DegV family protein [Lachnospiraceae bacterium]
MSDYILSCCSTADLTKEHFEKRDIKYICFHFEIDGRQYLDDLGESMEFHEFYNKMAQGAMTKTSQINVDEYVNYFESFLKEGKDIIHLSLSSGISGTVNSAMIARDDLAEKYPDRKIYVIDSLAASSGYGLLMDILADLRDEGKSIDELKDYVEKNRLYIHHWFFTTDLKYLVRGGRVSKTAGFVGNLLNICPLLNVNIDGKLIPREKIRTTKKVVKEAVEKMKEHAKGGTDYDGKCYISNSDCKDIADAEIALIEEAFPKLKGKIELYDIGTTIGAHTGPGTVALFFVGHDERTE